MPMPFVVPPPSLALEFQFDFHLIHNPTHVVALHPLSDGTVKIYTFADVVPRIHELAFHFYSEVNASSSRKFAARTPIIAILATFDAFTSFMWPKLQAILRAGMIAFPISPRFSPLVVAHLIDTVQPTHILTNHEGRQLTQKIMDLVQNLVKPCQLLAPTFREIFTPKHENPYFPRHSRDLHDIAYVIHSSSSSAMFPKTIHCSAHFMLKNAEVIGQPFRECVWDNNIDNQIDYASESLAGKIFGLQGLELFHFVGLAFINWLARSGFSMALLNPFDSSSAIPASPQTVFEGLKCTQPSYVYASPTLIEIWALDAKITSFLASVTAVITAGKRLNKGIGDALVKQGVHINVAFGSTETGAISILTPDRGVDWEYFYAPPVPEFQFLRRDDGYYNLVVLSTPNRTLPVCNTTHDNTSAYDPGDIFMRHPTRNHHYSVIGRSSDQIMLKSGEMVNPASIEEILSTDEQIKTALLFGHGQHYLGVLIEPIEAVSCDSLETKKLIANIQHTLDEINATLPSYSRVSTQMILVASPDKPILLSPKGQPRRALVLKEYEEEITSLYLHREIV
ncbi:hypothetical protein D9757_012692 [Collybiopsis confluens]|uniref:AMP-dependent synthetase/ligase domain-containing protein n=1 Tax=Collybiopsis confluens TaxID=2823264 RepID=A0A8H5GJ90_9AGAR|nr:hypothetical protein D9757_012692 [Collybiopsis confluens]